MVEGDGNNPYHATGAGNVAQASSPPKRLFDEWLEELWSVRLPAWLDDWSPQVAQALADGAWTALVRGVAAYAPVVAFVLGLVSRLIFPGLDIVYTESLAFMLLLVVVATLSGTAGVGLFMGYVVQDLLLGNQVPTFGAPNPAGVIGGKFISYFLLALPAIVLPLLARQLAGAVQLRQLTDPRLRFAGHAAIHAFVAGALVYLWSQSMLVLIRPLFSLVGAELPAQVVLQVQAHAIWLVLATMMAAVAREALTQFYLPRAPRASVVATLQRWRWTGEKMGVLARVPEVVRVAVATAVITMVLAGTYESWFDVLVAALVIGAIGAWRANLIRMISLPAHWALVIRRVHPLLRLLGAVLIGYVVSALVVATLWGPVGGLRLLMIGSLLTLIIFNLAFPPLPVAQPQQANAGAVAGSP